MTGQHRRRTRRERCRLTLRLLAICGIATAAFAVAWGTASGSTTHDIRGTYAIDVCPGAVSGTCTVNNFPQTWTITSVDLSTGAVSGSGAGGGQSFTITGTAAADTLNLTTTEPSYKAQISATISADSNSFTGTYTDSNHGTGTVTGTRTSGPPPPTSTTTTTTTSTATTTTPATVTPAELAQICAALYTNECAGLSPPPPVQTCVSLYQDCSGFGGTNPSQSNTIDLSGLTAPTPNSVQSTADCQATPTPARLAASEIKAPNSGLTPAQECMLKTYVETDTAAGDAEFAYNQNAQQFKIEVDAKRAEILLGILGMCRNVCPANPNKNKAYNGLGYVLAAKLDPYFNYVARPGVPVGETPLSVDLGQFCTIYADVSDQNSCRDELETPINETLGSAANALRARKHELGLDVPFTPPPKNSADAASARRHTSHPEVLLDGYVLLRPSHAGKIRLSFPRKLRAALTKVLHHGAIHGVLVVQASVVEGVTTTHRVKVLIRLGPRRHHR